MKVRHRFEAGLRGGISALHGERMGMTRDQELWACAIAVEREHGEGAFLHAAMEIDRLDAEGVSKAAGVWREVLNRLNALERGEDPAQ